MVALAPIEEPSCRLAPERRIFARSQRMQVAEARRLDHSLCARRNPRVELSVRDVSVGGMLAFSELPVEEGERVNVRFPPHKGMPWWDAFGRVTRCQPSALGYHVAVEFDPLPAA